jgi:hypothetical protein
MTLPQFMLSDVRFYPRIFRGMAVQANIALQQKLTISGTQAITPLSERSALQCSKPPETRSAEDGG